MPFPPSLSIPDEVLDIASRLEGAGYETWCVGGAIRDSLLCVPGKDFDLATSATPQEVRKLFRRTIPIGIEHGTVAVLDQNNVPHEVTTFRQDVKTDGRHAQVEFGVSLDEDLARRDFTINAIAYHPQKHEWRDLFNGASDLDAKVIRAVGEPARRFQEDYLRILRAIRFAARLGFEIEQHTWDAAVANVAGLQHLSAERVREEWLRGLEGAGVVSDFFAMWRDAGALDIWLPELMRREEGTLAEIDLLERRDSLLITSHLSVDPLATLTRLKCSRAAIDRGAQIGRYRDQWPDTSSEYEMRRWMAEVGGAVNDLVCLAGIKGVAEGLEEAVRCVLESGVPLVIGDLAVTGDDLLAAGVPKGPSVGIVLRALLAEVIEEPTLNTKPRLLSRVPQHLSDLSRG